MLDWGEVEALSNDILRYRLLLERHKETTLSPIADAPAQTESSYRWAAVDLFCRALDHAEAAHVLIVQRQGYVSVMATVRALFERAASLRYLVRHKERSREALVYRAYTYLRDVEALTEAEAPPERIEAIRARVDELRLPDEVRDEALRRLKSKHGWTGLSTARVLGRLERELGLKGEYRRTHRFLANRTNPEGALGHLEVERLGDGTLSVGCKKELDEDAATIIARFARDHLQVAFWDMWGAVKGPLLEGPMAESLTMDHTPRQGRIPPETS